MIVANKNDKNAKGDKQWDNPIAPEATGDCRDEEQLQRQYKEAKRRSDNLTDEDDNEQEHTN